MANKYRNKEQQLAICAAWKESRLTQTEFCRQSNIRFYALNRWLRNARKEILNIGNNSKFDNAPAVQDIKFFPVDKTNVNLRNSGYNKNLLEVMLPSGVSIRAYLPENNINVYLRELLK